MATPGTKNLEKLKFGQTYPKVPQKRLLAHLNHSGQKSALVNMVAARKMTDFTKGFWRHFWGAKTQKKEHGQKIQKMMIFQGGVLESQNTKNLKNPKNAKNHS